MTAPSSCSPDITNRLRELAVFGGTAVDRITAQLALTEIERLRASQPATLREVVQAQAEVELAKIQPATESPNGWETVRDILYRAQLPRNDPGAYCPGEIYERVAKEIAAAMSGVVQQAPVPAGWKLVPERPTQRQMDAGLYQSSADSTFGDVYSIYADMIDVAPSIDDHLNDTKAVAQAVPVPDLLATTLSYSYRTITIECGSLELRDEIYDWLMHQASTLPSTEDK